MSDFEEEHHGEEVESEAEEVSQDHRADEASTHPYNSYVFAATSWELRKNLTETFNKQIQPKKKKNTNVRTAGRVAAQTVFSVSDKIAEYEQKTSTTAGPDHKTSNKEPKTLVPALGKPPRKPTSKIDSLAESRCVSVFLRVRPPKEGVVNTVEILPDAPPTKVRTHAPERSNAAKINREGSNNNNLQSDPPTVVREFEFQKVFGPEQKQEDVYSDVVASMVHRMFPSVDGNGSSQDPESGLLFAYGATNAGKTYSILGKLPSSDKREQTLKHEKHWGIVPRAFQDILAHIEQCKLQDPKQDFELYLSYYEIYNENIYDLLVDATSSNPIFLKEPLKLRESRKQTFIRGLVRRKVTDVAEGLKYARQANSKRHTSNNNLNNGSSRSHCICQLQVLRKQVDTAGNQEKQAEFDTNGYNTDEEASQLSRQKSTTLWVVDLAGSERSKRTNVGSLRQKEASLINKSLMNLMRCLTMMRENQSTDNSNQIIPFRENKLTHLFMPIFTGRSASRISMIVNVNPGAPDFDETNHVLSYASQAKMVQIDQSQKFDDASKPGNSSSAYGYDGRPAAKKVKTAASKIKSLVKKLSPKKFMNKSKVTSKKAPPLNYLQGQKRKAVPPARVPSFSATSTTSTGSEADAHTQAKRMRLTKTNSNNAFSNAFASTSELGSNSTHISTNDNEEINSLKMALSMAKAEIEILRAEKTDLKEQMAEIESQVRMEVSEEMETQINNTKQHYKAIIDGMKRQMRPSLGVTEKQDRMDRASEQIDVLLFKVEEAEEEMERMRENHQNEIAELLQQSKEKEAAHQREILKIQQESSRQTSHRGLESESTSHRGLERENLALTTTGDDEKDVTIIMQQREIERLEKSKIELIRNYEKLLNDENDEEEGDDDEESDDDEEEEEGQHDQEDISSEEEEEIEENPTKTVLKSKHAAPSRYMTRTNSKQFLAKKSKLENRSPLSSISGNRNTLVLP